MSISDEQYCWYCNQHIKDCKCKPELIKEKSILEQLEDLIDELPVDWTGTGDPKQGDKDSIAWNKKFEAWKNNYKAGRLKSDEQKDKEIERLKKLIEELWWATENPFDKEAVSAYIQFKKENNL